MNKPTWTSKHAWLYSAVTIDSFTYLFRQQLLEAFPVSDSLWWDPDLALQAACVLHDMHVMRSYYYFTS